MYVMSPAQADLEKLCFGRRDVNAVPQSSPREHVVESAGALDINLDSTGHEFKVERGRHSAAWHSLADKFDINYSCCCLSTI